MTSLNSVVDSLERSQVAQPSQHCETLRRCSATVTSPSSEELSFDKLQEGRPFQQSETFLWCSAMAMPVASVAVNWEWSHDLSPLQQSEIIFWCTAMATWASSGALSAEPSLRSFQLGSKQSHRRSPSRSCTQTGSAPDLVTVRTSALQSRPGTSSERNRPLVRKPS